MSVEKNKCKVLRTDMDTPGGMTNYVILPRESDARAICFRQMRGKPDERCAQPAGYKTWHPGTGACMFHGGESSEASPTLTTGKYSKIRVRLRERIEEYLKQDRTQLLDLTEELAVSKAVFNEMLGKLPEPDDDSYGVWFFRFQQAIGTVSNLVDRIGKIDARNSLTAAQVMYLRATVADILMKYIPDPDNRERAARELASRMGGDVETEVHPREFTMPGAM